MSRFLVLGGSFAGAWLFRRIIRGEAKETGPKGTFFQADTLQRHSPFEKASIESVRVSLSDHGGSNSSVKRALVLSTAALGILTPLLLLWLGFVGRITSLVLLTTYLALLWAASPVLQSSLRSSQAVQHYHQPERLEGSWVKDRNASQSMDSVLDLAQVHGLVRQAIQLMNGCEINMANGDLTFSITSGLSWFKIVERYPLTGETRRWRRRDLRRGKHVGSVQQKLNSVCIHTDWESPMPGHGYDHISSPAEDMLCIQSCICIGGRSATATTVYRRATHSRKSLSLSRAATL